VLSSRVKDRPVIVVKDLKACGQVVDLCWRKRRLTCQESGCSRATFTRQSEQIPARSRVTARLRAALATAIARSNRAVSDVAAEHEVSYWHTAHKALVAAATAWFPEPEPTRVLGIDETRARSVRWVLEEAGWKRSNPWMTSFVDADTTVPGRLLGLAPGRSGACVSDWLGEQSQEFRDGIELVVIDPSAPYASGVRRTLPQARIAVDKWHLVALEWDVDIDPWAVVVRHGRWYVVCWAHRPGDRRAFRVDRVQHLEVLDATFTPPPDLDPVATLEELLAVGWEYHAEVLFEAPLDEVRFLARALGRLEAVDGTTTRLTGTTSNPYWYAAQLVLAPVPFRVVGGPELREATAGLGRRMVRAAGEPGP